MLVNLIWKKSIGWLQQFSPQPSLTLAPNGQTGVGEVMTAMTTMSMAAVATSEGKDRDGGLCVPVPKAVPVPRFAMQKMHELGRCIPCRFFSFKDGGCYKGNACEFCHLCSGEDALKRSKRAHIARKKQEDAVQRKLTRDAFTTKPSPTLTASTGLSFWL